MFHKYNELFQMRQQKHLNRLLSDVLHPKASTPHLYIYTSHIVTLTYSFLLNTLHLNQLITLVINVINNCECFRHFSILPMTAQTLSTEHNLIQSSSWNTLKDLFAAWRKLIAAHINLLFKHALQWSPSLM